MSKELAGALEVLEKEKGISKEIVIDALEDALVAAYKKNYGTAQNVEVNFNETNGSIKVYQVKEVTEEVEDTQLHISLEDAREINRVYEVGDKIKFEVTPTNFGRIAAQTAKQVVLQRMREAERSIIYNEYIQYEDDLMTGTVERQDNRFIYVNLGKVEAVLSQRDQIENEVYNAHDRIKVFVSKVEDSTKGPQVFVSRTHPNLIKRLFEQEVPEVYDGTVEIVSIAREAGDRSKVAVTSRHEDVDAVGTCVGPKGSRVQAVVDELNGENMDIVEWNEKPELFIENALNPAEVVDVRFNEEENSCTVVVPDYQLSLAIGKRGQNVRLAAKLTGYKIDIKPESEMDELDEMETEEDFFDQLDEGSEESVVDLDIETIPEENEEEVDLDYSDESEELFDEDLVVDSNELESNDDIDANEPDDIDSNDILTNLD
ncbi:MAG TPA: transcription termination factor NusA [Alloiococcus sp.]|nr:transcription termination factor NusA [Alloiococcus sp.]